MIRGALVSLIYARLLKVSVDAHDTGSAVTLMSTDVDSLSGTAEMFHEVWGHALEVLVGMTMLSSEIRWLWLVPTGLIFSEYKKAFHRYEASLGNFLTRT